MIQLLVGKVALVTGAGSDIGETIAMTLARAGATVIAADINLNAAQAVADAIEAAGCSAAGMGLQAGNARAIDEAVDELVFRHGGIDVLVADTSPRSVGPASDFVLAEWKEQAGIALDGTVLTMRAALRHMHRMRRGVVIYTGSEAELYGPHASLAEGDRVGALCRALVREAATCHVHSHIVPTHRAEGPERRAGTDLPPAAGNASALDDIAQTVLFLAAFPTVPHGLSPVAGGRGNYVH